MNAHPGEIIELEALTINGGEADANSVEVSLREIVGDIADVICRWKSPKYVLI